MLVQWTSKLCPFHISNFFVFVFGGGGGGGYRYTLRNAKELSGGT